MALATADWNPLGEVFYRKTELYQMEWMQDLYKYNVATAPYGGPIALIQDESKLVAKVQGNIKPTVYIYSAAGREITRFTWNSGHVIQLGWSNTEDLLCVQDDGGVLVYDIFGNFKRTFSLGTEVKDTKVLEVKIFQTANTTGIAVLTSTYRIFVCNNIEDPRVRRLAEVPGLQAPPSSWAIINQDRQTRALVAKENELFLLDHGGQYQQQTVDVSIPVESFIEMSVSFNNKYLALFTNTGLLWIGSADLQKVYCEFNTKSAVRPTQLCWCGTGSIVSYWAELNLLLMVGPSKDWVKYSYDTPVTLVQEIDGLRIIGNDTHEFLQRVPPVVEEIFKIGSMAPGAMLYEASREFGKGSQRADEYIRMIKDKLDLAVEQCIEGAGYEYEPKSQKALLRAASFGKCFLTDVRPETFVNMCQMLRVLNAVRDYTVGLPLTYTQLQSLTLPVLIDRLVVRRHYPLAVRICQYLKIPEADGASRIMAHWACYKVEQTGVEDEAIARSISQKLGDTPGVSYSEIANKALDVGRPELATRLLDYEPRAAEQVPLLMKMKKEQLALSKAIESGDTDLMYMVILNLKEKMSLGDFYMTIRNMPVAHALYLQYCRQENLKNLQDLYYQEDNFQEEGDCRVKECYTEERLESRIDCLMAAMECYNKARNEWAAKVTEEQVKLLKYQRKMEEELNKPYLNLSLHRTMYQLVKENNHKLAETLKKEFKVPDRRFWWLKIRALAEAGDWMELDRFSKTKKSPIGYEPFIEVCMENHNRFEATKYLTRVAPENKVKCHVRVGQLKEAAEIAFQQRNEEELNFVLSKCGPMHKDVVTQITGMKSQLGAKR
ncbi:vacuolar protein sorting-associated protein 16 homolog [Lingula anatina]|uniref:Vacuolar protein sorting-associated protein 16 homolog n=1 Tax=Lingula anatina TaxID=7574 RepID=A0A1S3I6Y6_LINAN|nr:vacuolar protein sorting-associated protein 16 homolog [Lingula anatina]|eukprot:XP_013393973.1 vacuolar protein sorting-associated protein 16 homolog [Lingula anatina]